MPLGGCFFFFIKEFMISLAITKDTFESSNSVTTLPCYLLGKLPDLAFETRLVI